MADTFRGHVSSLLGSAMDTFGETVKYTPLSGSCLSISGVFDDRFERVDPDTEVLVSSEQPVLGIKLADLGKIQPQKGDQVARTNGQRFRVIESIEDGHGGAMLLMHEKE